MSPLSDTGLLRHSNARERSLSDDHRLLAVADVAASSDEERRCSRCNVRLLLKLPPPLPLLLLLLPRALRVLVRPLLRLADVRSMWC